MVNPAHLGSLRILQGIVVKIDPDEDGVADRFTLQDHPNDVPERTSPYTILVKGCFTDVALGQRLMVSGYNK